MSPTTQHNQAQLLKYARDLADAYELLQAQNQLLPVSLDLDHVRALAATTRPVTVLFLELPVIQGRLEAAQDDLCALLDLINQHLSLAVAGVQAHGGTVERFAPTGLMASFGARSDEPGASQRAVAAAVSIQGSNEHFNREHSSRHWLDASIGIAMGPAALGRLGAPHRWEMGILGDCVNVAAGLATKARPGEILMEAEVYKSVEKAIRARPDGHTWIHGRAGHVTIYSLKALGA
ncbi:MAG: adenylate/guanylate cyclase domain-containing protein [Chloroflexota bacterium]